MLDQLVADATHCKWSVHLCNTHGLISKKKVLKLSPPLQVENSFCLQVVNKNYVSFLVT